MVTSPYFLATKLEAFKNRGKMDFFASHDFEDIVSVLDGRKEIVKEIAQADKELKNYLAKAFTDMNNDRNFHDALPGHFNPYGNLVNERIKLLLHKVEQIANVAKSNK